MKFGFCYTVFFCCLFISARAADVKNILPVTNKIIAIEFDEGHIDYFGKYQDRYDGNKLYYELLDSKKAAEIESYVITSTADTNFFEGQNPVNVGRKSKGEEFHNIYDASKPAVLKTHWIYLVLQFQLKRGVTYKIELDDLASNRNTFEFTFDEFSLRSPTVHVNQIGFVPDAPKYAYLSQFMGHFAHDPIFERGLNLKEYENNPFHLVDLTTNSVVFSGSIKLQQPKEGIDFLRTDTDFTNSNVTRADVWECDFSKYSVPGKYKITVEGIGSSYPFEIDRDIYREPFNLTARALFYQRSGITKEIPGGIEYPRDYRSEDGTIMRYYPELNNSHHFEEEGGVGEVEGVWGWYHDAGDFDTYSHHYRVPMLLLALYDLKPENFGDGDLNQKYKINHDEDWINEGENGIPDILDEAQWLINFYKRAKDSLIAQGFTKGGVPGYAGADAGAGDGTPCWEDDRVISLQGADSVAMSYRYSALSAYLAVCLNKFSGDGDHPESGMWLIEALDSYNWAEEQSQTNDDISEAKMEAAAALFRNTGEAKYQDYIISYYDNSKSRGSKLWFSTSPWHHASIIYSMIPEGFEGLNADLRQKFISDLTSSADLELVSSAGSRGFRYGLDKDIIFMLGTFSVPHIVTAAAAYELTGEKKYLDVCYTTSDYCLGGNQMNMVKVTGLGDHYEKSVFHPSSWYLYDFNSRVYRNPILPGYTAYEMHRTGDWQGNGNEWNWVGDEDYSRSTSYPSIQNFPDSEARFQNRNSIAGSEFTIHQNQILAVFAYGYLCDAFSGRFEENVPPSVVLNLPNSLECSKDTALTLEVSASSDTEVIEYYYDWHFIGRSADKHNDFRLEWNMGDYKISKGNILITAIAIDDKGKISNPSSEADVIIKVLNITSMHEEQIRTGKFELFNNYPNPFNPATTLKYEIAKNSSVNLKIFDILGNHIKTIVNGHMTKGIYESTWNGKDEWGNDVASGIYFQKLIAGDFIMNKKMTLLR